MRKIEAEEAKEGLSASKYARTQQFVLGLLGFLNDLVHRRFQANKFDPENSSNRTVEPCSFDVTAKHAKQSKPKLSNEAGGRSGTTERATTFYLP